MSVSSRPSSRTHRARVTRRTMGSSGLEPGLRRQKERKSWVPEQDVRGRLHGPQVERIAHMPGHRVQAAGRAPGRSRPGSGRCGRVAERRASNVGGTSSAASTTMEGASWRLSARARPTPSKGMATAGRHGPPGPGRAPRHRCGRHRSGGAARSCGPCGRGRGAGPRPRSGPRVGGRSPGRRHRRRRSGASSAAAASVPAQIDAGTRRTRSAPSARCHRAADRA